MWFWMYTNYCKHCECLFASYFIATNEINIVKEIEAINVRNYKNGLGWMLHSNGVAITS